jgi:hypothetical protein
VLIGVQWGMENPKESTSDPHEALVRIKDWVRRAGGMRVREPIKFSSMDDELHLVRGMTSKHIVEAIREDWEVQELSDESFSLKPKPHAARPKGVFL